MVWIRKRRIRIKAVLLLASLLASGCVCVSDLCAASSDGIFNLNINYPGVGLRDFLSDSTAIELRGQAEKDIRVIGVRLYFFPGRFDRTGVVPYWGIEGDYGSFKGIYSKGNGYAAGGFAGLECFLGESLSLQTDAGAAYLLFKDADTAFTQGGMEFILNFGINIYF